MGKVAAVALQPCKPSEPLAAKTRAAGWPRSIEAASVSSPLTDGLKFRMIVRGKNHFFKNVRFKSDGFSNAECRVVSEFFEGRCLENLSPEALAACFGRTPLLPGLQELIADLQHVFCYDD